MWLWTIWAQDSIAVVGIYRILNIVVELGVLTRSIILLSIGIIFEIEIIALMNEYMNVFLTVRLYWAMDNLG